MEISRAKEYAESKLREHGLDKWQVVFDRSKNRFGACNYRTKSITLSMPMTYLNSEEEVRLTILHEVAHALTKGHGHNVIWRKKCVEIGGDGKRLYDSSSKGTVRTVRRYQATCAKCGTTHYSAVRTRKGYSCAACSKAYDPDNILVWSECREPESNQ